VAISVMSKAQTMMMIGVMIMVVAKILMTVFTTIDVDTAGPGSHRTVCEETAQPQVGVHMVTSPSADGPSPPIISPVHVPRTPCLFMFEHRSVRSPAGCPLNMVVNSVAGNIWGVCDVDG